MILAAFLGGIFIYPDISYENMAINRTESLIKKAALLPQLPGVYIMKDTKGNTIYIGKAKRLRNRVSSYFRDNVPHDTKVMQMVATVGDFEFIVTDNEFEALILECSLIKQNKPKFNILLKDDKGFSYVKIGDEEYPKITVAYRIDDDNARYLGPYIAAYGARNMVETATSAFKLPICNKSFPKDFGKSRPCLNHHIGRCMGLCSGKISKEEYLEAVEGAVLLVTKGAKEILATLYKDMLNASENLEFERAARIRDRIATIEQIDEKQKVIKDNNYADSDVFAFASDNNHTSVVVLKFRNGMLSDKDEEIYYNRTDIDELREEFITHYYILKEDIPKQIFIDETIESLDLLSRMLSESRGTSVAVSVPQRGEKRQLINMAYSNAVEALNIIAARSNKDETALAELASLLNLKSIPNRIEAYDISNFNEDAVAGMGVFVKGQPKRYEFKRFIIKTVDGIDDYASMAEVLSRRITRYDDKSKAFMTKPDLILIDGGKGHLSTSLAVIGTGSFSDVPVFGMVKDKNHHTRDIVGPTGELRLSARKNAFSLVTRIQDETHRFTISYQQTRHTKKTLRSSLLDIEGIGEVKAKILMDHFKTIDGIKTASVEELNAVEKIDIKTAERIYMHFNDGS